MQNYLNQAKGIFMEIQMSFPELEMIIHSNDNHVDLSMEIPKQRGLEFDINLNLQTDELHISTSSIWCSFFPTKDQEIVGKFKETVKGIIKGNYRIAKLLDENEEIVKSQLQKTENGEWITVFTDRRKFSLPWIKCKKEIIRNTMPNG